MIAAARNVSIALCLLALSTAGCEKKPASFRLDNGLRVELLPVSRGDKAALVVLFDVGGDDDPPGRSGMAHVVEHLFTSSTRLGKTSAPTLQSRTGADYTLYASEVLGGRILEEIDDAAARMAGSGQPVTDAELTSVRKHVLDEVASMQERDATAAAMIRAAEALRPGLGAGMRGGTRAEIEAITPAEAGDFRRAHYGTATARLIVAGRFNVTDAEKRIRAAFGALPAGKAPPGRAAPGSRAIGTLVLGDAPGAMALAVAAPAVKDPLYPAFVVLAARLAAAADGSAGGAPRVWKADFAPLARPELLFVTSPIPPGQQAEPAAERTRAEVRAIAGAPLASDEPARALVRYGGQLGITPAAEPRETAFAAARLLQLGVDAKTLERAMGAVTQDQLAAAARLIAPRLPQEN